MFEEHQKVTIGFVTQTFYTLPDGTMVCKDQDFIAGEVDYIDMNGESITIDTDKEVYCPFEMKQPKQIPDPKDAVKFVCPDCGDTHLEVIMDGDHTTVILGMFKSGSVEYGDTESAGFVERFQCVGCGMVIADTDSLEAIKDDDEVTEWCKANCNQE